MTVVKRPELFRVSLTDVTKHVAAGAKKFPRDSDCLTRNPDLTYIRCTLTLTEKTRQSIPSCTLRSKLQA